MRNAHFDDHLLAEINITPFTDVLLVLLIIFMILAALEFPPGFQKRFDSHCATHVHATLPTHEIEVEISSANRLRIDQADVAWSALYAAIAYAVRAHHRAGYSQHIALVADARARYDRIIWVLDAAHEAGDNDVGFVTY